MCEHVCAIAVAHSPHMYTHTHTHTELREEDLADKAPVYIENCIGRSEPLAKVRAFEQD